MADYLPLSDVMKALGDRLRVVLSEEVDAVILFDGNLTRASNDHFGQATQDSMKSVVFVGLTDDTPHSISAAGIPIQSDYIVDIFAIVRSDGRERYTNDRDRLWRISDQIKFDVFDDSADPDPEFRKFVASQRFVLRRRGDLAQVDFLAHLIRYQIIPNRTR